MELPLSGIKVLDLSRVLAGPWASQILGDLGAEIIKVEHINGDDTRKWGPPFVEKSDKTDVDGEKDAAYFLCANRNKKSISVDFSTKEGIEIITKLAKQCHILIENFLPNKLAKYGLDYKSLEKISPHLIYCSITGYGQYGQYANLPGYDFIIQGQSGLMSVTGNKPAGKDKSANEQGDQNSQPLKTGVAISDIFTGMYAVTSILAALRVSEKYGKGDHLDVALFDCQFSVMANQAMNYSVSGNIPKAMGNEHPNIVPYQVFQTKTKPIIIAIGNDQQFKRFTQIISMSELGVNEKFSTNKARVNNRDEISQIIQNELCKKEDNFWLEQCKENNVPAGPVNNIKDAFNEKNIKERELLVNLKRGDEASYDYLNYPVKFANHKSIPSSPPPFHGEHSKTILKDLGYTDQNINELLENEVIK